MLFRKTPPAPQPSLRQVARISVHHQEGAPSVPLESEVIRISPSGIRLAVKEPIDTKLDAFFQINRTIDVVLPLPKPHPPAVTRGRLVGVAQNYTDDLPPFILDLEFLELTEKEEQALRESNPGLLVS
jgi:hypothetical protein